MQRVACRTLKHDDLIQLERNIAPKLRVHTVSDWYNATSVDVIKYGGRGLLECYDTFSKFLQAVYPTYTWVPWKFRSSPLGYWDDLRNQGDFLEDLGENLCVKCLDDWYDVSSRDLVKYGGIQVLAKYSGSISTLLQEIYPNHVWHPWQFSMSPLGFWENEANQRDMMERIARIIGVSELDDWYNVQYDDIINHGGTRLINLHGGSLSSCLKELYPKHNWKPWKFRASPQRYWEDVSNQLVFLNSIGKALAIYTLDEWYTVTTKDVYNASGVGLFSAHDSLSDWLQTCFPHFDWEPWRFSMTPVGFWSDIGHQRQRINYASQQLDLKHLDEWHNVSLLDLLDHVGVHMLGQYGGSLWSALKALFPDHRWNFNEREKKNQVEKGHWQNQEKQLTFLKGLAEKLRLEKDDWYRVSKKQLIDSGGASVIPYFPEILKVLDPRFKWQWGKFSFGAKKSEQLSMLKCLFDIFPNNQIIEEHIIGMRHSTGEYLSVDAFIPDHAIAFEYQGAQHYHDKIFPEGMWVMCREARDIEKLQQCNDAGITLVRVPYWWKSGDIDSLKATINVMHPGLCKDIRKGVKPLRSVPAYDDEHYTLMAPSQSVSTS